MHSLIAKEQSIIDEISNLKTELHYLNIEIESLKGENPDDIGRLSEKVTECEQREADFQERIVSILDKFDDLTSSISSF